MRSDGFSMIEVLVALVVAGALIGGYVGLSQRSIAIVDGTRRAWDNINFTQEFLSKKSFTEHTDPSMSFTRYADWLDEEAYWQLEREEIRVWDDLPPDFGNIVDAMSMDELGKIKIYTLQTKVGDSQLSWMWLAR